MLLISRWTQQNSAFSLPRSIGHFWLFAELGVVNFGQYVRPTSGFHFVNPTRGDIDNPSIVYTSRVLYHDIL